eukprot:gnl/MRDRNA2_/MRDRNA2_246775_c0_seq1.p1 gnl/MRDRNA2_/MRDRNA2_246775_c0~~gnl/MRDRNA2_/MRDRNA2_246775_c0_seq1.p1  ORF type:complete len:121 (-),score=13.59 gnl/MRDRNA2_/MRDRNA2_246775_c0_seq1:248-610(-)
MEAPTPILSSLIFVEHIYSINANAFSHYLPVSQALTAVFILTSSGCSTKNTNCPNSKRACGHCPPLWHALMVALKLLTSNSTAFTYIIYNTANAFSHFAFLSQELIDAFVVGASGYSVCQ